MTRLVTTAMVAGWLLAGAMAVPGCQADRVTQVGEEPRELIAYAATAKYPGEARSAGNTQLVAIDNPGDQRLEIYNLTSQTVLTEAVWVNGSYVTKTGSIPPNGSVSLRYGQFVESGGGVSDLKSTKHAVRRVEVQTKEGLVTVQGPTRKSS